MTILVSTTSAGDLTQITKGLGQSTYTDTRTRSTEQRASDGRRPISQRRKELQQTEIGQTQIKEARRQLASAVEAHGVAPMVALRLRVGLSQKDLVERTGLPQPHVSRLENGRVQHPDVETLVKLADALGVSLDQINEAYQASRPAV